MALHTSSRSNVIDPRVVMVSDDPSSTTKWTFLAEIAVWDRRITLSLMNRTCSVGIHMYVACAGKWRLDISAERFHTLICIYIVYGGVQDVHILTTTSCAQRREALRVWTNGSSVDWVTGQLHLPLGGAKVPTTETSGGGTAAYNHVEHAIFLLLTK